MAIHQVLVTAAASDAVTHHALALQGVLADDGPSEVYAHHVEKSLRERVRNLTEFPRAGDEGLVVFHASIAEPAVTRFLDSRPERVVLVYHNLTPPEFLAPYDPERARLLEDAREIVVSLRDRVVLALGDSAFNAAELVALGYAEARVSPLVLDLEALLAVTAADEITPELREHEGPVVLFVGQMAPHKRPDLLASAYHVLRTYLRPDCALLMVGPTRLDRVRAAIERFLAELHLPSWALRGEVSPEVLAACYRRADAFVTLSEHEGVCVPLIEAMTFELPILARRFAAVPETLGDAGLLLAPEDGPAVIAEALAELLENESLRLDLVARGRERRAAFDPDMARRTFASHIKAVL